MRNLRDAFFWFFPSFSQPSNVHCISISVSVATICMLIKIYCLFVCCYTFVSDMSVHFASCLKGFDLYIVCRNARFLLIMQICFKCFFPFLLCNIVNCFPFIIFITPLIILT